MLNSGDLLYSAFRETGQSSSFLNKMRALGSVLALLAGAIVAQENATWRDIYTFNTIYDLPRFAKTADFTSISNGVVMASLPAGTRTYRIESGDISEDGQVLFESGNVYWCCPSYSVWHI